MTPFNISVFFVFSVFSHISPSKWFCTHCGGIYTKRISWPRYFSISFYFALFPSIKLNAIWPQHILNNAVVKTQRKLTFDFDVRPHFNILLTIYIVDGIRRASKKVNYWYSSHIHFLRSLLAFIKDIVLSEKDFCFINSSFIFTRSNKKNYDRPINKQGMGRLV